MSRGEWPAGEEVERHLRDCDACAEVLMGDGGLAPAAAADDRSPPAVAWADVEAVTQRDRGALGWLRARPTPARWGLVFGAGLLTAAAFALLAKRADWEVYPAGRRAAELATLAAMLVVSAGAALRPLYRPRSVGWDLGGGGAAALAVVGLSSLPPAHLAHPASLLGIGDDFVPRALGCLVTGTLAALPLVVLLAVLDRGAGRMRRVRWLTGVSGAVVGVLALAVHCPLVHQKHLWGGHVTALVSVVLLTVGIAPRIAQRSGSSATRRAE